jgi:hypothetical protein
MRELRWLLRAGPPIAALAAAAMLGSVALGTTRGVSGQAARTGPLGAGCAKATALVAAARAPVPVSPQAAAGEAAYAVRPRLGADGALAGQIVELGTAAATSVRLELPPESFAAGPFGRLVVVGVDDGRRSTLRAFDATRGCSWTLATESDVIRRATLDPAAGDVYEFRVDRETRADLGVWRRPLVGRAAVRVVAPLAADDRHGTTFSTELSWSADGDVLVVQSCGMTSCRTRLLMTADGGVRSVEADDQGEVIGLVDGLLIAYAACRGLPCPIQSVDVTTGERATLAAAAGLARIVATGAGPRLLHEVGGDDDRGLRLVDPVSAASASLPVDAPGWRVVATPSRAGGSERIPPGWAPLSPDGRATEPGQGTTLLRLEDGTTIELTGVTR